jgi:hypothetical protein
MVKNLFVLFAKNTRGPDRDWGSVMGLGGVLQTFLILGALIFAVIFILSKIDKPRRPPGPDTLD